MHTLDYEMEVIETFKKRKKRQLCVSIPLAVSLLSVIFFLETHPEIGNISVFSMDTYILGVPAAVACGICLLIIVGCLIFSLKNWRCPHCNTYLGKVINPRHCNHCGIRLK